MTLENLKKLIKMEIRNYTPFYSESKKTYLFKEKKTGHTFNREGLSRMLRYEIATKEFPSEIQRWIFNEIITGLSNNYYCYKTSSRFGNYKRYVDDNYTYNLFKLGLEQGFIEEFKSLNSSTSGVAKYGEYYKVTKINCPKIRRYFEKLIKAFIYITSSLDVKIGQLKIDSFMSDLDIEREMDRISDLFLDMDFGMSLVKIKHGDFNIY